MTICPKVEKESLVSSMLWLVTLEGSLRFVHLSLLDAEKS